MKREVTLFENYGISSLKKYQEEIIEYYNNKLERATGFESLKKINNRIIKKFLEKVKKDKLSLKALFVFPPIGDESIKLNNRIKDLNYINPNSDIFKDEYLRNELEKISAFYYLNVRYLIRPEIFNYFEYQKESGSLNIDDKNSYKLYCNLVKIFLEETDSFVNKLSKHIEEEKNERNFISSLKVDYTNKRLPKLKYDYSNAYEIKDNIILFYPPNDGMPRLPVEFYKNGLVIDNKKAYSEITNLDSILKEMVRVFDKAIDNDIIINPYGFMLKLTDDICEKYSGKANLVIPDKAIRNRYIDPQKFNDAKMYFINRFLDHFIGWNFGVSVNRSVELREKLEKLNDKVINLGLRKDAGPGFEVYGGVDKPYNGLQHYYLKTEKSKTKNLK